MTWPVYVSLAEARAYAHWQGKRILTEPEFHRAAYGAPDFVPRGSRREYCHNRSPVVASSAR